ncbi:iron ABC transporter permease [Telmatospirillum sp. J64-1]|uniref:FecCD family ABC transporter permease n=1 Tax=Telmatospirillum sp. J64-1 TaxID=2502183 RepID=UPI00115DE5C7|nr:iron ABC transporter permease [Telmatospirillum sp. J64-1]
MTVALSPRLDARRLAGGLFLLLGLSCVIAVGFGAARIPLSTVWGIIGQELWPSLTAPVEWSRAQRNIVWELRLPRVLLSALAGAGLAGVGAVLQVLTRNPLADPYLFGVSAGASVGAVSVILFAGSVGTLTLPLAAFLGALAAMIFVFAAARGRDGTITSERLVLTGVAVAFILHAVTNALIVSAMDRGADSALFWMMGGFGTARWSMLPLPALLIFLGLGWLCLRASRINTLALGDDTARSLGIDPARLRLELFLITALITGAIVSVCGGIGFVGLVLPHVARLLVGGNLRVMLPVAILGGALFMVWVDVIARVVFAPREIPVGVVTALVGGFFFLWLMRRRSAS